MGINGLLFGLTAIVNLAVGVQFRSAAVGVATVRGELP